MSIASFSVDNRVPVNLLLFVMIVGGFLGFSSMPREVFPRVSIDVIVISTAFPGVSPEEIETELTLPIEKALKSVKGIAHIESSSVEGLSAIEIELAEGRSQKLVAQDVRSALARIDDLPEKAEEPLVIEIEFETPVVVVAISGLVPENTLREGADVLEDLLLQIDGVASVVIGGYREQEVWVEIDPGRLSAMNLGILDIMQALKKQNLDLAGGRLKGPQQELLLRTVGEFKTLEDINSMIVRFHKDGRSIRLRDVGKAVLAFEEEEDFDRIGGQRAISLNITKKKKGDAIAIMAEVETLIAELEERLPKALTFSLTQNSAVWIQARLKTLYINGAIGFTLVCLTLFTFLDFRMALWTALGIPASFLGGFFAMSLLGQTVNMLSLFALILVLGLVVDDAIIVTENVYRHLKMGYSPKEAAIRGTDQVVLPVIATIATTIAAFMPMLMMTGILGKFMRVIPIIVCLILIVSLFEALLILPSHLADFSKKEKGDLEKNPRERAEREGRVFLWFRRRYQRLLILVLRWRYLFLVLTLLLTVFLVAGAYTRQRFVLFDTKDIPGFMIMIETPTGTKLSETGKQVEKISALARSLPTEDVSEIVSLSGRQIDPETGRVSLGSHLGQVYVELSDFEKPDRTNGFDSIRQMRKKLAGVVGLSALKIEALSGGPPVGAAVEIKIRGENLGTLRILADVLETELSLIAGVYDIRDDSSRGKRELQYRVDPERAARYGLDTLRIAEALRTAIKGEVATQMRWGEENIDIVLHLAEPFRSQPEGLDQLKIKNDLGILVPLKNVARPVLFEGLNRINRKDHRRTLTVSAEVDSALSSSREVTTEISEHFEGLRQRFPGYGFEFGGETEEQRKSVLSLLKAFTITALIIYMILGGLFKSFLQPVVVMVAVPFGIIGVVIGHFVMDQSLSLLSLIGVVALSGIVVNDSLLLVDFINQARRKGVARWSSIVSAGRLRMRPILLTTLTTILGLLTLSFQTQGQAGYLAPMAISIVWGLFFATGLTLLLVPALFAIADDLSRFAKKGTSTKLLD